MGTQQKPSASTTLISQATREKYRAIERLQSEASHEIAQATAEGAEVLRGIVVAKAMQGLRNLLTPDVMQDVMMLQNTPLGFLTDKPQGGYPSDVVRDCLIVALLSGFKATGNEFNIIAGKFYMTKEGARSRVLSWPGLSTLELEFGVPQIVGDKGALVEAAAKWKLNGQVHTLECAKPNGSAGRDTRIPVRVNAGMGADAILGKAARKLYARILERLTGMVLDQEDDRVSEDQIIDARVEPTPDAEPDADAVAVAIQECYTRLEVAESLPEVDGVLSDLDSKYAVLPAKQQDTVRKLAADVKANMRKAK